MSFYEATFTFKWNSTQPERSAKQVYKATDLEDAIRQHERTTEICKVNNDEYLNKLVTMHEVKNKKRLKELEREWNTK